MINDIETVNQTLSVSLTQMITSFTTIIGILIMMLRISVIMTVTALVVLPLSMIVIRLVVSKTLDRVFAASFHDSDTAGGL